MVWQGTVNPPLFGANRFDPYHLHHVLGLKVFMDAHEPVTLEEGDRYPYRPPDLKT